MDVDQLRQAVEDARRDFRSALDLARARWETRPAGGGEASWAPRQVAEHVMGAELGYAGGIASALGHERPAWETFRLTSVAEAAVAMDHVAAVSRTIMAQVTEDDLPRRTPSRATVLEVLQKAAHHLSEHARQVRTLVSQQSKTNE